VKYVVLCMGLALTLGVVSYAAGDDGQRCRSGQAQGFISVQEDPPYLVGTIPSKPSFSAVYFNRRFNCLGRSAAIRRVDLGIYDVFFPGLPNRTAVATAISENSPSVSVFAMEDTYRVYIRGPLAGADVASRRDLPFSLVIY
jgi:hypothetical protein